jgi:hypothetical protein
VALGQNGAHGLLIVFPLCGSWCYSMALLMVFLVAPVG